MKSVIEEGFSMNSHSTAKRLKRSSDFESVENVWSLNIVEFEFELRYISNYQVHSNIYKVMGLEV